MQPDVMMQMLKSLKLHGMAQALGELAAQDSPAYKSASLVLAGLLKAEIAEREVRSLAYQMKAARFPAYRDIGGFDFSCSDANEALVRQLYECEFIDSAHNIVLVGGPGTGKTHLATAIGVQALEHHRRRVRFFSTIELVNALEQEKLVGKPGQLATRLVYADLVVLILLGVKPDLFLALLVLETDRVGRIDVTALGRSRQNAALGRTSRQCPRRHVLRVVNARNN